MAKKNVTGIVLGAIGGILGDLTDAAEDGKITLGEIVEVGIGVVDKVGSAFKNFTRPAYVVQGDQVSGQRIVEGFAKGFPFILDGFGVRDMKIGNV